MIVPLPVQHALAEALHKAAGSLAAEMGSSGNLPRPLELEARALIAVAELVADVLSLPAPTRDES